MRITVERERYHQILLKFRERLAVEAKVMDVGKHRVHNYREFFPHQHYMTIDRDPKAGADHLGDVERINRDFMPDALSDAILVNGVTEVCSNPFALARGAFHLLKPGGLILLGSMSVAYPLMDDNDFTRFTPKGARQLLEGAGFVVESQEIVERDGVPSYTYTIAARKG